MKKIRNNVFETNSSSTHSITICYDFPIDDTIELNEDSNVILNGGKFGWGYDCHSDALTKANYCAIDQMDNDDNIGMLKDVIKEVTKCNNVIINICNDWNDSCYSCIDHQSRGESDQAFESKGSLAQFIFCSYSELEIDNDN